MENAFTMNKTRTPTSITQRVRSELRLKLALLIGLNLVVWTPYITLQRIHFFPPTEMPITFVDRAIPFSPNAVWFYLSIYLLLPIGPFLLVDRAKIFAYSRGVLGLSFIATLFFIFCPATCARPIGPTSNHLYQALVAIDNPYHAFPSLHAAFAIYSSLCALDVVRSLFGNPKIEIVIWTWAALILYATIATRQHVLIDLIGGSILGFLAHRIFLSNNRSLLLPRPIHAAHEN
jgi:membrane-associated phospholipid phosphatase